MILRDKLNTRIENKPSITDQANVILSHRYLLKNSENKVIETPKELFKRVAKAVASIDTSYGKLPVDAELTAKDFYLS